MECAVHTRLVGVMDPLPLGPRPNYNWPLSVGTTGAAWGGGGGGTMNHS